VSITDRLCLIHSEVSEAVECVRDSRFAPQEVHINVPDAVSGEPTAVLCDETKAGLFYYDGKPAKPEGLQTELADVVIRVLDLAETLGIDLETAMEQKDAYNQTRPHRHGGKRL
jgi:NTP pyrophosphatase (non-canonical NTP hydrolase)